MLWNMVAHEMLTCPKQIARRWMTFFEHICFQLPTMSMFFVNVGPMVRQLHELSFSCAAFPIHVFILEMLGVPKLAQCGKCFFFVENGITQLTRMTIVLVCATQ